MANSVISYVARGFSSLKDGLRSSLETLVPSLRPILRGSVLDGLLNSIAGTADMLSYYIDAGISETQVSTATRVSSLLAIANSYNIEIKGVTPATGKLLLVGTFHVGDAIALNSVISPATTLSLETGSVFSIDNTLYRTTEDVVIYRQNELSISVDVDVEQAVLVSQSDIIRTYAGRPIVLGTNITDKAFLVSVNGEAWTYVEDFRGTAVSDEVYTLRYLGNGLYALAFGGNVFGSEPVIGATITIVGLDRTEAKTQVISSGSIEVSSVILDPDVSLGAIHDIFLNSFVLSIAGAIEGGTEVPTSNSIRAKIVSSLHVPRYVSTSADVANLALAETNVGLVKVSDSVPGLFNVYVHSGTYESEISGAAQGNIEEAIRRELPLSLIPRVRGLRTRVVYVLADLQRDSANPTTTALQNTQLNEAVGDVSLAAEDVILYKDSIDYSVIREKLLSFRFVNAVDDMVLRPSPIVVGEGAAKSSTGIVTISKGSDFDTTLDAEAGLSYASIDIVGGVSTWRHVYGSTQTTGTALGSSVALRGGSLWEVAVASSPPSGSYLDKELWRIDEVADRRSDVSARTSEVLVLSLILL